MSLVNWNSTKGPPSDCQLLPIDWITLPEGLLVVHRASLSQPLVVDAGSGSPRFERCSYLLRGRPCYSIRALIAAHWKFLSMDPLG